MKVGSDHGGLWLVREVTGSGKVGSVGLFLGCGLDGLKVGLLFHRSIVSIPKHHRWLS